MTRGRGHTGIAGIALAAMLVVAPSRVVGSDSSVQSDNDVKAALVFNFAKFVDWSALPDRAPIRACVVGAQAIAAALVQIVGEETINGHAVEVSTPGVGTSWRECQLLFLGRTETRPSAEALRPVSTLPILTISDSPDFLEMGGIVEFYVERSRLRFAINLDAVERSGLRVSARLLGLAKIVRGQDVP